MGDHHLETRIRINAPIELVWDILTNFENYSSWNSFIREFNENPRNHQKFSFLVKFGKVRRNQVELLDHIDDDNYEIVWGTDPTTLQGRVIKAQRYQGLNKLGINTTEYHSYEDFHGVLGWLVRLMYLKDLQESYHKMARDLKRYAEELVF